MGKKSKSKKPQKEKFDYHVWADGFIKEYKAKLSSKDSSQSAPAIGDDSGGGSTEPKEDEETLKEESRCKILGCKRKEKYGCINRMCFAHCNSVEGDTFCETHLDDKRKKEKEDQYIQEALSAGSKRKIQLNPFEEKFKKYSQTVTIWCLKDFCRFKRWNQDLFAQYEKEDRQRLLLQKRQGGWNRGSRGAIEGRSDTAQQHNILSLQHQLAIRRRRRLQLAREKVSKMVFDWQLEFPSTYNMDDEFNVTISSGNLFTNIPPEHVKQIVQDYSLVTCVKKEAT